MGFAEALAAAADATDAVLAETLDRVAADGVAPPRLVEATRYALLGGGKRFRPFLVIEAARLAGGGEGVANVAAGFECLHAYSLVHDDLPAMDDDDLRRGRPTVHKAYDEATAILVGDGLQALAFELVSAPPVPAAAAGPLATLLARASGNAGMVGGQFRDLNALGLDEAGIRLMQGMKTGALIAAACEAGALVAGADAGLVARLAAYGRAVGEAFQLADDLLDIEGTAEETGKRVGKDADARKATVAGLIGPAAAREKLAERVADAVAAVAPLGDAAATLVEAARFVAARRS